MDGAGSSTGNQSNGGRGGRDDRKNGRANNSRGNGGGGGRRGCYTCGEHGHIARNCPNGRGRGNGNTGRNERNGRASSNNQYQYHIQYQRLPDGRVVNVTDPSKVKQPKSLLFDTDWDAESQAQNQGEADPQLKPETSSDEQNPGGFMYADQLPPEPPFEFEPPATEQHLELGRGRKEAQKERNLVKSIAFKYEIDCRGLHNVEDMCQFCDGRRAEWAQDEPPRDRATNFSSYQSNVVGSWPEMLRGQQVGDGDEAADEASAREANEEGNVEKSKEDGSGDKSDGIDEAVVEEAIANEEDGEEGSVAQEGEPDLVKLCEKFSI